MNMELTNDVFKIISGNHAISLAETNRLRALLSCNEIIPLGSGFQNNYRERPPNCHKTKSQTTGCKYWDSNSNGEIVATIKCP